MVQKSEHSIGRTAHCLVSLCVRKMSARTRLDRSAWGRAGGPLATAPYQTISEVGETTLYNELARRAAAVARGRTGAGDDLGLPEAIDAAERRAHAVARAAGGSEESRRGAALDFVADVATSLVLDGSGDAGSLVSDAAAALGIPLQAASLAVFRHAVAAP